MKRLESPSCCYCQSIAFSTSPHKLRLLGIALISIASFAGIEAVVGWASHSLALVADSGHMAADGLAIALAIFAAWMARRSPHNPKQAGIEVWAALVNGVGLVVMAGAIALEAVRHLQHPPETILSGPMFVTAVVGLGVNGFNLALLHRDSRTDINLRGVLLHVAADTLSSVGAIVAAIAIWKWHWNWADGAIGLGVATAVGLGALPLIRRSLGMLLTSGVPGGDETAVAAAIAEFAGVVAVEDLTLGAIAPGHRFLTATLKIEAEGENRDRLLAQIQTALGQNFGIEEIRLHVTPAVSPQKLGFLELGQTDLASLIAGTRESGVGNRE